MVPGAKPSETPLEVYAPYDGAHLATVPTVGAQGVDSVGHGPSSLFGARGVAAHPRTHSCFGKKRHRLLKRVPKN